MNKSSMTRREFLGTMAAASAVLSTAGVLGASPEAPASSGGTTLSGKLVLLPFDYSGVRLHPSRWQKQYDAARDFYLGLSNDDILHGFRVAAGLPAPGKTLGGWAKTHSYVIFGQWIQAMARAAHATDDAALRDKASLLVTEWGKTLIKPGNFPPGVYPFEKMVGGLVDMRKYANHPEAPALLEKLVDVAIERKPSTLLPPQNLTNHLAVREPNPDEWVGNPKEWYTVGETLYRAYETTGQVKYREFADFWRYPQYWDKFINTSRPADVHGLHAYSHLNTFNTAAMAYAVSGDPQYLKILTNAYDYWQDTQCYATGGFGPAERTMPYDGALGDSLEIRNDSFETACGSWAGFKLSKYLLQFTGQARYGDWIERLLYNGIGASLPIAAGGRTFYYSNYNLGNALKAYYPETFPCCSGTYFQAVTEYHDLIYFQDGNGLCVNLYVPSEVSWKTGDHEVKLVQETLYPEAETISLKLEMKGPVRFPLKFRVPEWATGLTARVNGAEQQILAKPGSWAVLDRTWQNADAVEIQIPLALRRVPVDKMHPDRVAIMHGPVVLAQEAMTHDPLPAIPKDEAALAKYFKPDPKRPGVYLAQDDLPMRGAFRPFYTFDEGESYRIYFDPKLRRQLW